MVIPEIVHDIQDAIDAGVHPHYWPSPQTIDQLKACHEHLPDEFIRWRPSDYDIQRCPELAFLRVPWQTKLRDALRDPRSQLAADVAKVLKPYLEAS